MAANTISYRISLEGSEDASKKLAAFGDAGEQAFKQIQDAAKTESFASTTASISKLGSTAEQAFAGATAAAKKFGATQSELQGVESSIRALAARSRDSSTSFAILARNYDNARRAAAGFAPAVSATAAGFAQVASGTRQAGVALDNVAKKSSVANREMQAFSKVLSTVGLTQLAGLFERLVSGWVCARRSRCCCAGGRCGRRGTGQVWF